MGAADGFPVACDVDDVDASANDVLELDTGAGQGTRYVGERLTSLGRGVTDADELSILIRRRSAGDVYPLADAHGARVADDRLPGGAGGEVLTGNVGQGTDSLGGAGVGETHSASCAALEGAVDGAGVVNEVQSGPRIAGEELVWQEIALEAITAAAGGDQVAGGVNTTLGERQDVIDCRDVEVERGGAVHTPPAAITHHGVFDRALLVAAWGVGGALGAFGAP